MDIDFLRAAGSSQLRGRNNVVLVAVHTTGRYQPHEVDGAAALNGLVDGGAENLILLESAFFQVLVDTSQALIDHAPCAQVHMANFRVTHLPLRQPDKHP